MPEDSFLQPLSDLVRAGGVLNLDTGHHFKVTENGGGADMSVDVNIGRAFVKGSTSTYPVRHTGSVENLAISSNASGSTRKDTVVLYIDLAASPNSTATDVAVLAVVEGTPSGSPVAPSDGDISTAIGASNPFLRLADVTVANGAATIENASILDQRVPFATINKLKITTATDAAPTIYDLSKGNYFIHSMGADRTSSLLNLRPEDFFFVELDSNSHAMTWFSGITWEGGLAPVLSGGIDLFAFVCVSAGVIRGSVVGQNYS